jgi:DNA transposition AAA+ family ATPase
MTVHILQARLDLGDRPSAGFAQLTNMALGLQTYLDCAEARPGLPRIGVLYGPSGYGKSVAMAFTAQRTDAAYLEAKSVWTQRSLLVNLARELGIAHPERTAPLILEQIVEQLLREPRGLIFDEFDYLVKRDYVEIIRDIHESTGVPILLVGEESLPQKLKRWERFHNRILVQTPAQPATVDDARQLRTLYSPRVEIADDLVGAIVRECRGVTRRIVTNLTKAERLAIEDGRSEADLKWWGERPFDTGDVPVRRMAA